MPPATLLRFCCRPPPSELDVFLYPSSDSQTLLFQVGGALRPELADGSATPSSAPLGQVDAVDALAAARGAPRGVRKDALDAVAPVVRGSGECVICLGDGKGRWRVLPCGHRFHARCLARWLEREVVCPVCRGDVLGKGEGEGEGEAEAEGEGEGALRGRRRWRRSRGNSRRREDEEE